MKRRIKTWTVFTFCDWCRKQIKDYSHTYIERKGRTPLEFHSQHTEKHTTDGSNTCYELYMESQLKKVK